MGSLAHIARVRRHLICELHEIEVSGVWFEILELGSLLAHIQTRSSLVEEVRSNQRGDPKLCKIRDEVKEGKGSGFSLDEGEVLRFEGR